MLSPSERIEEWEYGDFKRFMDRQCPETIVLEYKSELAAESGRKTFTKELAALANTLGGTLILGIHTKPNSPEPIWPPTDTHSQGILQDEALEGRLLDWCGHHIYPPLAPDIKTIPHPSRTDRTYIVVRVHESMLTPHVIENGTGFYVRHADRSTPVRASLEEIERMRNRRARAIEREDELTLDILERCLVNRENGLPRTATALMATFGREDALSRQELYGVLGEIGSLSLLGVPGFQDQAPQSYSHGVLAQSGRWRIAVTTRGDIAISCETFDKVAQARRENVQRMVARPVVLAEYMIHRTRFRGRVDVLLTADGFRAATIETGREWGWPLTCQEECITVKATWEASDLSARRLELAARLEEELEWSLGYGPATLPWQEAREELERQPQLFQRNLNT